MLETLDAAAVRRWCGAGLAALRAHQREIDELNVYPVPDGDTGTNLVLTLTSAQEALEAADTDTDTDTDTNTGADRDGVVGAADIDGSAGTSSTASLDGWESANRSASSDGPGSANRSASSDGLGSANRSASPIGPVDAHSSTVADGESGTAETEADGAVEAGTVHADQASSGVARAGAGGAGADRVSSGAIGAGAAGADGVISGEIVAGREAGVRGAALGRVMRRMARGALLGARGNSGVIVSQILRGMADAFAEKASVRGAELARALRKASEAAYAAVARPVEGTVLSVVAAAAEGASRIKSDDLLTVARAAAKSAAEALARTPQQLPVLARAGVVDAGGRGLVVLLEALVEALSAGSGPDKAEKPDSTPHAQADEKLCGQANEKPCAQAGEESRGQGGEESRVEAGEESRGQGDEPHTPAGESHTIGAPTPSAPADDEHAHPGDDERAHPERDRDEHATPGYEVQYLLDAEPDAVATLRIVLDGLGNSLVIVGTGDGEPPTWNVHVHVDDIGAAIEAGIRAGRPHRISVMPLSAHQREERPGRGAVVVAAGEGLARLFRAEGAVVVERNPSIAEMLTAIAATGANRVVLLPNDANTHAVATAAAREATSGPRDGGGPGEVRVSVVPTRSPVQALAALAVRDEQRRFDDDVIAMAEAAGACRYGEVTTAAREALTVAGRCRPGDLIGLVDSEVNLIGGGLEEVCRRLLDRMLGGGGELVTLVLGADAPASLEPALRAHVAEAWPFVEVQCYAGGQPRYHLLAGVE